MPSYSAQLSQSGLTTGAISPVVALSDGSLVFANYTTQIQVWRSVDRGQTWSVYYNLKKTSLATIATAGWLKIHSNGMKVVITAKAADNLSLYLLGLDFSVLPTGTYATIDTTTTAGLWYQVFYSGSSGFNYGGLLASDGRFYLSYYTGSVYKILIISFGAATATIDTASLTAGYCNTLMEMKGYVYGGVFNSANIVRINMTTNAVDMLTTTGSLVSNKTLLYNSYDDSVYLLYQGSSNSYSVHKATTWSTTTSFAQLFSSTFASNAIVNGMQVKGDQLYIFGYKSGATLGVQMATYRIGSTVPTPVDVITIPGGTLATGITTFGYFNSSSSSNSLLNGIAVVAGLSNASAPLYTYTYFDTEPDVPTNFKVNGNSDNTFINTKNPTFSWTFSDPDSGDTQGYYQVVASNDNFATWYYNSPIVKSTANSYQLPINLPDGVWQFAVRVADTAQVWSTSWAYLWNVTIDTVAPTITSVSPTQYINGSTSSLTLWAYGVSISGTGTSKVYGEVYNNNNLSALITSFDFLKNGSTSDWYVGLTSTLTYPEGVYTVKVYARDNAGNLSSANITVYKDSTIPISPTQTNGVLYSTSNSVSWGAFSDGSNSSGLLLTTITLEKYNGSTWDTESGYPKSVVGLTYSFTGLIQNTQYRWTVTYTDNSGNASVLNYTTFTTNSTVETTINNMVNLGGILTQRPKFKFISVDANDSNLTDFQIQVSTDSGFSDVILNTTASTNPAGWLDTQFPSGWMNYYTPQINLGSGNRWVRIRAYDGKEWGTWGSAAFKIYPSITWVTTINSADTAVSKRTIDDLRFYISEVRSARGLAPVVWTDETINNSNNVSPTLVRAQHLIELRQAIKDIYTTLNEYAPTWTDNVIDTTINRKGQHWLELRNALLNI